MKPLKFLIPILLCLALAAFPSMAKEGAIGNLSLRGEGVKRVFWKKVFKVKLYAPTHVDSSVILDAHPKCLQVEYYVGISRQKLGEYIQNKMSDNADQKAFRDLQPSIQSMESLLPDIHPGDSLTMCYQPFSGTDFIYNNQSQGIIAGDQFASVIFATWIGRHPVDSHLKRDLLGSID